MSSDAPPPTVASDREAVSAASTPRRDKFAAMASRPESATIAPKRDKFAAMASRGSDNSDNNVGSTPKRDKLAAMARRPEGAVGSNDVATTTTTDMLMTTRQAKYEEWEKLKNQRAAVWRDLEEAEAFVLDLLDQAQQTATVLAQQTSGDSNVPGNDDDDDDNEMNVDDDNDVDDNEDESHKKNKFVKTTRNLANMYREALTTIHDKLAPHADLVKAYKEPQRINHMYQARIEEGLARQKKELLSGMLQLEEKQQTLSQQHQNESNATQDDTTRKRGIGQISSI